MKRMGNDIVRTFNSLLNEWRHPLADCVQVVAVIQWALNAAYRERYQACLYNVICFGAEPRTPFTMLAESRRR